MKLVMPDTNVYGWAIAKRLYNDKRKQATNSSLLIEKLVNEKGKENHLYKHILVNRLKMN